LAVDKHDRMRNQPLDLADLDAKLGSNRRIIMTPVDGLQLGGSPAIARRILLAVMGRQRAGGLAPDSWLRITRSDRANGQW
jgi:hypothetical protein